MTTWQSTKIAFNLLPSRDRRLVATLVTIQSSLAFLDLIGVAALGVVAALAASLISGQPAPTVARVLDIVGLSSLDIEDIALWLAVGAGLLLIGKSILSFLLMRRTLGFLASRQAIVAGALVGRLLAAPIGFVMRRSSQLNAYALIGGVNSAMLGVLGNAVALTVEGFLISVLLTGLFIIDPAVTLATLLYFTLIGLALNRLLSKWTGRLGALQQETDIASLVLIQNAVRTFREVSVSGRRPLVAGQFRALRWRAAHILANVQISQQVSKYIFEIALVIGAGLLAWTQFSTQTAVSAATVVSIFLVASSRLMPAFLRLQNGIFGIRTASGAAQPTFALSRELQDVAQVADNESKGSKELEQLIQEGPVSGHETFGGELALHDVSYWYPEARLPSIKNISIRVPSGTSMAIVGPSGAGKSTLADLMLGIVTPTSGSITIGGLNPQEAVRLYPGAIAYVPQDVVVVDASIRSNVALGLPLELVNDELVWDALDKAHLAEFLAQEMMDLDMNVGEHGIRLSGGQRQRLGLARALYSRPRLIVLDEATSALDAETENAITETLEMLSGEVTLVVIAHRLATVRNCDQVAYFEQGDLKGLGTFDEVRRRATGFNRQAGLLGL